MPTIADSHDGIKRAALIGVDMGLTSLIAHAEILQDDVLLNGLLSLKTHATRRRHEADRKRSDQTVRVRVRLGTR